MLMSSREYNWNVHRVNDRDRFPNNKQASLPATRG